MKFVEFQGVIVNLDQVKLVQKSIDNEKIKRVTNPQTGDIEEVLEGKPFQITLDMGDNTAINFTYLTRDERDSNYLVFMDVLQVPR